MPYSEKRRKRCDQEAEALRSRVFGRLVVIGIGLARTQNEKPPRRFLCRCICGTEIEVTKGSLVSGHTQSCGCLQRERAVEANLTHGASHKLLEYEVWKGMHQRCTNPKHISYKYYGARGIKVCKRWKKFENFIADIGLRPDKTYTIERRNSNKNYTPSNCYWEGSWSKQVKSRRPFKRGPRKIKESEARTRLSI